MWRGVFRAPHAICIFSKKISGFRCVGFSVSNTYQNPGHCLPKVQWVHQRLTWRRPDLQVLLTEEIWLYRFGSKNWGKHPKKHTWFHDGFWTNIHPICWFVKRQARRAFFKKARVSWISLQQTEASLYDQCCRALVEDSNKTISLELARWWKAVIQEFVCWQAAKKNQDWGSKIWFGTMPKILIGFRSMPSQFTCFTAISQNFFAVARMQASLQEFLTGLLPSRSSRLFENHPEMTLSILQGLEAICWSNLWQSL